MFIKTKIGLLKYCEEALGETLENDFPCRKDHFLVFLSEKDIKTDALLW